MTGGLGAALRQVKVLHVTPYFAPARGFGGPPHSVLALCHAQRQAGIEVEVFTTTANAGHLLTPSPDGVELEGLRVRRFPLSAPAFLLGARAMRPALRRAARAASVVHVHGLFNRTTWIGADAARAAGAPLVVSTRGMLAPAAFAHHRWRKRAVWLLFDRRVIGGAACLHATSHAELEALEASWPGRHVVDIPNTVDVEPVDEAARLDARAGAGVPAGAPYVLFLGRIHPIKRLDVLASAFASVAVADPRVHLVIAGPDERRHRQTIEPLFAPVASRVHWTGEVGGRRKAGLLAGAGALVLCSDSESFGLSVAEALAAGVPVVVTRTCPWPMLERVGCGFWVEQDPAAMAAAIVRILRDPVEACAMGRRGRDLVAREYSAHVVARRWLALYRELAARS
jgi:glycosyltransferase involved in cell wall biosynthesis